MDIQIICTLHRRDRQQNIYLINVSNIDEHFIGYQKDAVSHVVGYKKTLISKRLKNTGNYYLTSYEVRSRAGPS